MANLYIITGTSRGLGEALLETIGSDGTIICINRKNITYTQKNITNLQIDLASISKDDINQFEKTISASIFKNTSNITFINNAFSMGQLAKFSNIENDEIKRIFNINLISSTLLIKSFINVIKSLPIKTQIINISSGAAKKAIDGWSLYCVTKSSLEMLIESIKVEYPKISCFNIDPGVMDTQMQSEIRNFITGSENQYFVKLFENNRLQQVNSVAQNIFEGYLK